MNHLQLKMARAALGWTQEDLSAHARISFSTIYEFENGRKVSTRSIEAMKQAVLETNKIEFLGRTGVNILEVKD